MIGDRKTSFTMELARFLEFIDEFAVKRHETKEDASVRILMYMYFTK